MHVRTTSFSSYACSGVDLFGPLVNASTVRSTASGRFSTGHCLRPHSTNDQRGEADPELATASEESSWGPVAARRYMLGCAPVARLWRRTADLEVNC